MTLARARGMLVGLALLVGACSLPGSVTGSRELTATFEDVGDLVVGHSVQIADVRIGSITDIELDEQYRAVVTMSVKDDAFIPKESRAVLRTTSLLGEKFIELRPLDPVDPMSGTNVVDGDVIAETGEAPELEFVAEQAIEILGSVVAGDVQTLVETGAVGFGGRAAELTTIVEDLSVISGTLAAQTDELVRIIDAIDGATRTLAPGSNEIGALLLNLADTTKVLSDNRQATVDAIEDLTRLARVQNDLLLEPYLADMDRQLTQLDAVLAEVVKDQQKVADLLFWLAAFTERIQLAIPDEFAQVYALFEFVEPAP